jgi:SAM-dependent MidA family methyltransferase
MTALKDKIARLVSAAGPISVADYMATCLFDPQHGYYTTREPFGAQGDFTTAPEISQMFGELAAAWLVGEWRSAGSPAGSTIAEIGPGRGTMMKDMARTILRLAPELAAGARFALVETSPRLRDVQRATLAGTALAFEWHDAIATLRDGPLFIVGNELFDALPVRQFGKTSTGWRERMVGLSDGGELAFVAGAAGLDPALLPPDAATAAEGAIVEVAPAREALMEEIAARIARQGGAGLFIDYGHLQPAVGDTLQALARHRHEDVLASPGQADLTAHVDFAALAAVAARHGLAARLETQGDFLLRSGLLERAGALGAGRDEVMQERLGSVVERLAGPAEMGNLFKVLSLVGTAGTTPSFAVAD